MLINLTRDEDMALVGVCYENGPARGVPCFTLPHLDALLDANRSLDKAHTTAKFQVLYSTHRKVFSLGGDLRAFVHMVRNKNKSGLCAYALRCMQLLLAGQRSKRLNVALVQGQCRGGGWECVLAHDYVIAEEQSTFAFPEVQLGTFPGMGALSLLSRKLGTAAAFDIALSGTMYTAEELFNMGLVDALVGKDEGWDAVANMRGMLTGEYQGRMALKEVDPIPERELSLIVQRWVNTVMALDGYALCLMDRVADAQENL